MRVRSVLNSRLGLLGPAGLAILLPASAWAALSAPPASTSKPATVGAPVSMSIGDAVSTRVALHALGSKAAVRSVRSVRAASLHDVGTSPSTSVVARAPRAVSVTFDAAPDPDSISMKVFGPDGEVSAAQPQLAGNAIRRPIDKSVPGGKYVVKWKARSDDGDRLSGSFTFIAARGTGSYESEPARPTGGPTPIPEDDGTFTTDPVPSISAAPTTPSPSPSPNSPTSVGAPGDSSASGGTGDGVVRAEGAAGKGGATGGGSLSTPLKVVPFALGGLLVLASAAVGLISARRLGADPTGMRPSSRSFDTHAGGAGA